MFSLSDSPEKETVKTERKISPCEKATKKKIYNSKRKKKNLSFPLFDKSAYFLGMGSWTHAVTEAVKKSGGGEEAKGSWFESITHAGCPTSVEPSGGYRDKRSCPLSDWVRFVSSSVFCFVCVYMCFQGGRKKKSAILSGPQREQPHHSSTERGSSHQQAQSVSQSQHRHHKPVVHKPIRRYRIKWKKEGGEILKVCQRKSERATAAAPPPNLFHILVPRSSLPNKRNANGLIQRSGLGMSGRSARFRQRQCFDRPCNS